MATEKVIAKHKRNRDVCTIIPSTKLKVVNVHKIQDSMTCDRYYYWRWVLNLIPQKINLNFWYGSIIHKGMEFAVNKNPDMDLVYAEMRKESAKASKGYVIDHFDQREMDMQLEIAFMTIKVYTEEFDDKLYADDKIIGKEVKFAIPLSNSSIVLTGTMDGYSKRKNAYYLREYKSASRLSNDYFARLKFDKQINMYAYGLKYIVGVFPAGCPYMVFRKPQIGVKKDESVKQFFIRLEEDMHKRADWYFIRNNIRFGRKALAATMNDVECSVFDLQAKYDYLGESGVMDPCNWARNDRACFNYGTCPYFMLCKNVTNYDIYLPFFRMREIRYQQEELELRSDLAFSTKPNSGICFSELKIKQLRKGISK